MIVDGVNFDNGYRLVPRSCLEMLADFRRESVTVTVTSPPYKKKDGYTNELMDGVSERVYEATRASGLFFVNFAHLTEDWGRPFDVWGICAERWKPVTTIIWIKSMVLPPLKGWSDEPRQIGHYTPIQGDAQINNLFEYIFVFSKGDLLRPLDRWSAPNGVPFSDKSNIKRGTRGKHGDAHCGGNVWVEPEACTLDADGQPSPCWYVPYTTKNGPKLHPYEYPEEIVERCLALSGAQAGEICMDPFAGSGTTLVVARRRGMLAGGYELDPAKWDVAHNRLKAQIISPSS